MRRSGVLRHVASGLGAAFIGRNNDLDGYWAPGLLYAQADPIKTVTLDLLNGTASPATPAGLALARRYAARCARALAAHGVTPQQLARAEVVVDFAIVPPTPLPRQWPDPRRQGDIMRCVVRLERIEGACAAAVGYVHCWRHDPGRESRSGRYGRAGEAA
jgi:hypothetical protein